MNEPLNASAAEKVFTGKTHNKHPHWHNQPLRLTKEQRREPLPVLDDFFECYHLNEVRQTLWEWLTEVLSSPRTVAIESLDRNNHIYFYEKIEGVIEAVFVIKKKIHKHRRKKENRKKRALMKSQAGKDQAVKIEPSTYPQNLIPATESVENYDKFNKPKQLIEFVDENPMYVLIEVFNNESLFFIHDQLSDWLLVALSADTAIYKEGEQRKQLISFHEQLLVLMDVLFIIYTHYRETADVRKQLAETDNPMLLSQQQIANHMQAIGGFFEKFPIAYITRELNDWLEASICFAGTYPENMSELQALNTYRNVLCLIKAANRLLSH